MRRGAALLLVALAALALPACSPLDPFEEETLPPLERFGVRISSGLGAAAPYLDSVEVTPPSTAQFIAKVADGKVVEFSMPRGPAPEITVTATLEGSSQPLKQVTITSADGKDIEVDRLYSFDPGFVSVEDNSTGEELRLRVATPRLTGTGQGAVSFGFKTDIPGKPGARREPADSE